MAKIRLTDHKKQLLMFPKETVDNQITEYPIVIDISLLFFNKTAAECQGRGSVKWAVFFSSSQWALTQGCHFPDNMKSPAFSRPRLSSSMSPRSFIGVWGMFPLTIFKIRIFNLAKNEFQTTKFPDF